MIGAYLVFLFVVSIVAGYIAVVHAFLSKDKSADQPPAEQPVRPNSAASSALRHHAA